MSTDSESPGSDSDTSSSSISDSGSPIIENKIDRTGDSTSQTIDTGTSQSLESPQIISSQPPIDSSSSNSQPSDSSSTPILQTNDSSLIPQIVSPQLTDSSSTSQTNDSPTNSTQSSSTDVSPINFAPISSQSESGSYDSFSSHVSSSIFLKKTRLTRKEMGKRLENLESFKQFTSNLFLFHCSRLPKVHHNKHRYSRDPW